LPGADFCVGDKDRGKSIGRKCPSRSRSQPSGSGLSSIEGFRLIIIRNFFVAHEGFARYKRLIHLCVSAE
jgi:hypothetical protein